MKKLKLCLVLGLIFVAGFVSGVVATRIVVRHFVQQMAADPDRVRLMVERRLGARLKLDATQRRKVHEILTLTQVELRGLRSRFAPEFQQIVSNAESQVSATLTPEQRERFERFREENRRFWRSR